MLALRTRARTPAIEAPQVHRQVVELLERRRHYSGFRTPVISVTREFRRGPCPTRGRSP